MAGLGGRRILVIGASSGIGHAAAVRLGRAGARLVLAARRVDRLKESAAEAGPEASVVRCDVREEADCEAVVASAVDRLGGLDDLVYATGMGPLVQLIDADQATWREALETNLLGAALVTRAAVSYLEASEGRAIYFSSTSASITPPWPGLNLYVVSKAGLDKLIGAWRSEHPGVSFTRVVIGPTVTEFAEGWDPELFAEAGALWVQRAYLGVGAMDPDLVASEVVNVLASPARVDSITIQPPTT
jgi:NAD(P)-dependent dehydrogenase (short-subunit alcohol dehydrogenase family)